MDSTQKSKNKIEEALFILFSNLRASRVFCTKKGPKVLHNEVHNFKKMPKSQSQLSEINAPNWSNEINAPKRNYFHLKIGKFTEKMA